MGGRGQVLDLAKKETSMDRNIKHISQKATSRLFPKCLASLSL